MKLLLSFLFDRSDVLLAFDLGLTRQLLFLAFGFPLLLHPLPDFPGQTDRLPGLFLKAREQLLRLLHGLACRLKHPVPLADIRILLSEIRHRISAGDLA
ncbi:hypothetical protein, partial [Acetobacter fabarum]|uniref:hypothetical protein n=1 Tax=Acetobacter fabarum TaxID=483199 RepID=UPI00222EB812